MLASSTVLGWTYSAKDETDSFYVLRRMKAIFSGSTWTSFKKVRIKYTNCKLPIASVAASCCYNVVYN